MKTAKQTPFHIHFQYGSGDLGDIVSEMAKDTVIKSSHQIIANGRVKKIPRFVQVV